MKFEDMARSRHGQVYKEDSLKGESVKWNLRNSRYRFEKNSFEKNAFKVSVPHEPV